MAGLGYAVFDTAIGRCGIVWSDLGIVGVQLPEAREIDTRRRLFRLFAEARELRPPLNIEHAIEGISALLRGGGGDLSDVALDLTGIIPFNQRVYELPHRSARRNPHLCRGRGRPCVSQAPCTLSRRRWPQKSLHDHRPLPSRAGGTQLS